MKRVISNFFENEHNSQGFSTKASTNTLELSRIVLSRKNLTSSQSSSDNVAKPSISKLQIPFRAHYRTKWRHFVFDRPFGRARADKMPICFRGANRAVSSQVTKHLFVAFEDSLFQIPEHTLGSRAIQQQQKEQLFYVKGIAIPHFCDCYTEITPNVKVQPRRIGSSSHNALRLNYIIVVFDYVTIHLLWISSRSCRKPRRHSAKESLFISIASISEHRKVFSSINFLVFK